MLSWVNAILSTSTAPVKHNEGWEFLDSVSYPLPDPEILSETLSDFAWKNYSSDEESDTESPELQDLASRISNIELTLKSSQSENHNLSFSGVRKTDETESVHSFLEPNMSMLIPTLAARRVAGRRRSLSIVSTSSERQNNSKKQTPSPAMSLTAEQYFLKLKNREQQLKKLQKLDHRQVRTGSRSGFARAGMKSSNGKGVALSVGAL
ncbi:hypothetical protein HK096_007670 [Nowakowskiella sp. JEL0078]|nr:hypothetical protein HK096_007670 [Nowakowskiella sp. JEL0078]